MESQDKLGWKPFIYGRVATTWEDAQYDWLIRLSTRYKRSCRVWSTTLVQQLFKTQWSMWENRNTTLHDKDHIWQKHKRALWDKEIENLFKANIQDNFLPEDMRFFQNGLKKVLLLDDNAKQQWLASVTQASLRKHEKSKQRSRKDKNDLMSWINIEQ